jgi:hypothetical protein
MDQGPVPDALFQRKVIVNHAFQTYFTLDAAYIDQRHLLRDVGDLYYLARDS